MVSYENIRTSNLCQLSSLYSGMYIYVCLCIFVHEITIDNKEVMNLKKNKERNVGGFGRKKGKEMI